MQARFPNGLFASVSSDGSYLATAGANNTVAVWDLATGELVKSLEGGGAQPVFVRFATQLQELYAVVVYPDDRLGALAWNLETGNDSRCRDRASRPAAGETSE